MVENGRKKGGRQGPNGLCVVTKTNAWKTVRCESVERRRGGDCLTIFWFKHGWNCWVAGGVPGGWRVGWPLFFEVLNV